LSTEGLREISQQARVLSASIAKRAHRRGFPFLERRLELSAGRHGEGIWKDPTTRKFPRESSDSPGLLLKDGPAGPEGRCAPIEENRKK